MQKLYRWEHKESGFGPFEHADQKFLLLFDFGTNVLPDIDHFSSVKEALSKNPNAKFAFTNKEDAIKFAKHRKKIADAGFVMKEFSITPLVVIENQALFCH